MFERHCFRYDFHERPCACCEEFWRLLNFRGNIDTVGWKDNGRTHGQIFGILIAFASGHDKGYLSLNIFPRHANVALDPSRCLR